jgi:hypothetical protein
MERVAHFQILLLHVSRIHHKSCPDKKKFHPSLEDPRKGTPPSLNVSQNGAPGNRHSFPEPYLTYSSGSPVKEPSLQVPLVELPQREMLCSRVLLHSSFKVPGYEPPSRFPSGAPMEREAHFQSLLLHNLQVPQ